MYIKSAYWSRRYIFYEKYTQKNKNFKPDLVLSPFVLKCFRVEFETDWKRQKDREQACLSV